MRGVPGKSIKSLGNGHKGANRAARNKPTLSFLFHEVFMAALASYLKTRHFIYLQDWEVLYNRPGFLEEN